jgi:RNA polymerase sigma-70 factor (ECF subfamily)
MPPAPSFADLLAQLRRRDPAAAAAVFRRYRHRLIGLARQQLDGRLRRKLDPEDVVLSVFRTVFRRLGEGQFDLGDWDSLWGLLTCVTVRKCGRWQEHFHAQACDLDREATPAAGPDGSRLSWEFFDREPGPEEAAVLAETAQQALKGLNAQEQQVLALSLQGGSVAEVSRAVGCSESEVYRVPRHVRRRPEQLRDGADDEPGTGRGTGADASGR